VGKNPIPIKWPANELIKELRLCEIAGVHPAVRRMIAGLPAEPITGLRALSDQLINEVFGFPRIVVIPVRGGSGFWCWIGIRPYLRLVDCGWPGKITVLVYGPRMSEQRIVDLALLDWEYASAITGSAQTTDWAAAQRWKEDTDYVCRPAKSGNRLPSGLNAFARLRGLDPRRLRADNEPEASKFTGGPRTMTDEEGGNKD
jgi:hypothetical protein